MARPSKGPREKAIVAYPRGLPEIGRAAARAEGFDGLSDYMVYLLARELGMPQYEPKRVTPQRETLPMAG